MSADRTPTDYALEHAEYMAGAAERMLQAIAEEDTLRLRREESDDVAEDTIYDASMTRDEFARSLRERICEFRKRRDRAVSNKPLDENTALREMAKHAHRALNAASNALATVEDDIPGDETTEDLARRCGDIACSLFSLLRGNEIERYESGPFSAEPLPEVTP
jgi:hypothetical protein